MSISTMFDSNNFKIYCNDLTIRNLNLSSDGNYKIKFPSIIGVGSTLSVLAIDNVIGDVITLKWLQPSENIPFDVINCRIINVEDEINCLTGLSKINHIEGNIIECSTITAQNEINCLFSMSSQSIDIRDLIIRSDNGGSTIKLKTVDGSNGDYYLPTNYPSTTGQFLSSSTSGTMTWQPISQPPSVYTYLSEQNTFLNSDIPSRDIVMVVQLDNNSIYNVFINYKVEKSNSGGEITLNSIYNVFNASGDAINYNKYGGIYIPDNYECSNYSNFVINTNLDSGIRRVTITLNSSITAGGILQIRDITCVLVKIS